jgi:hypothetical protein
MFYDEVDDVIAAANCLAQRRDVEASHIFVGVMVLQKAVIQIHTGVLSPEKTRFLVLFQCELWLSERYFSAVNHQ